MGDRAPTSTGAWRRRPTLAELGARTVDLHGQHAHQSLLSTAAQRDALDRFCVDRSTSRCAPARARLTEIDAALAALGGDQRSRAREVDLLRFQVGELAAAAITRSPTRTHALSAEEDTLADAAAHREAGQLAVDALAGVDAGDDGCRPRPRRSVARRRAIAGRAPFDEFDVRLRSAGGRADRHRRPSLRASPRASRRTQSGSPRSASAASCCATCDASTASRWPMSSPSTTRLDSDSHELESYDERVAALERERDGRGRLRARRRGGRSCHGRRAGASKLAAAVATSSARWRCRTPRSTSPSATTRPATT